MLEYLDRANLFLIPLDNERCWYRYHHLFSDLLRFRAAQTLGQALVARATLVFARQEVDQVLADTQQALALLQAPEMGFDAYAYALLAWAYAGKGIVRQADAAGVEKEVIANPPQLWQMGVPVGKDVAGVWAEQLLELLLWRIGEDQVVEGGGRAVETQETVRRGQPEESLPPFPTSAIEILCSVRNDKGCRAGRQPAPGHAAIRHSEGDSLASCR
ncbi:MAG: hypothetical protein Fur0021_18530 [Candidatus Promineifilaceae bacterium]